MVKEKLFGKTLGELSAIITDAGLPAYTAKQIAGWLYKRGAPEINAMTDLSLKARSLLDEKYETGLAPPSSVSASTDGTRKYLFRITDSRFVETAYIPDRERATVCLSVQS